MKATLSHNDLVRPETGIDFVPVTTENPRSLSRKQIKSFNEKGFISPLSALSEQEASNNKRYFDDLLKRLSDFNDGRDAYSIMNYHDQCKGLWELAQHPVILDYIEDLIGPDIVCWTTHYFCKLPNDRKPVAWHQDATYWPIRPTRTVTVWLAVDDVNESNSPMEFIEGSHTLGAIPWERAPKDTVLQQEIPEATRLGSIYTNVLPAGSISLHTSTLVHGSSANVSMSQRRCGLTLRYIPPSCGVLDQAKSALHRGIVCRGNGGAWTPIPEPAGEDMSPKPWHRKSTSR